MIKNRFPLIGDIGKVSNKAFIRHIAKPVLPIKVKPLRKSSTKTPANAKSIRIEITDRVASKRLVNLAV
jgi:hypothetical protein